VAAFLLERSLQKKKVFNTTVENSVEKQKSIFVSGSASDSSALCTAARAGTFVVLQRAKTGRLRNHLIPS
jgi:hypothetical protein